MCSILLATYGLWMLPICHHVKSREQKLSSCTSRDVCNLSYIVWTSNHLNFLSLGSSTIHEGVYILLNSVYYCMFQIFLLYTSRKWMSVEKAGVFFLKACNFTCQDWTTMYLLLLWLCVYVPSPYLSSVTDLRFLRFEAAGRCLHLRGWPRRGGGRGPGHRRVWPQARPWLRTAQGTCPLLSSPSRVSKICKLACLPASFY